MSNYDDLSRTGSDEDVFSKNLKRRSINKTPTSIKKKNDIDITENCLDIKINLANVNQNLISLPYPVDIVKKYKQRGLRNKIFNELGQNITNLTIIIRVLKWFIILQKPLIDYNEFLIYTEKWLVKNQICSRESFIK